MYNFTKKNLIVNKENYFYTDFFGKDFISYYLEDREKQLIFLKSQLSKKKINFKLFMNNCENEIIFLKNNNNNKIDTFSLFVKIINSKESIPDSKFFDLLLQKFEVSKKIFNGYSFNKLKGIGNNNNPILYILFGFILIKMYNKSKNLVYLNSLLKIGDIISSQKTFKHSNEIIGSIILFEKELLLINSFMKENNLEY